MSVRTLRNTTIGKTKSMRISRLTGQVQAYTPVFSEHITEHLATVPDTASLKTKFQTELDNNGIDAQCDQVVVMQGVFSDTYLTSYAVADTTLDVRTFEAITIIVALIAFVIAATLSIVVLWYIGILGPTREQTAPIGSGDTGLWTYEHKYSWLLEHYWYVCANDLSVVGERAGATWVDYTPPQVYATKADVPQDAVSAFEEHCANAPNFKPELNILYTVMYVAIGIAAAYIAVKVIPPLFAKHGED